MSAAADDQVLVGRDQDVAALTAALRRRGAVVIAGDAGVGKTRLARELLALVPPGGGRDVRLARATRSAQGVPLGAFAPWLPIAVDGAPHVGTLRQAADALADGPDAVLGVDDAHHLDGVSATVLHQLAERRAVRMVVTVRSGEVVPDAVTALWKEGLAQRWTLAPLSQAATAELAEAVLGGRVDADLARTLLTATHGNPLWLRHLLDGERVAGRLTDDRGIWRWTGRPTLSPELQELVTERVGTLTAPQREALELLALGEPLGPELLSGLVDHVAVEDLADRGLVRVGTDGARREVWLGHPLYGEVVRSRMGSLRARRLKGVLSDALGVTAGRRAGDVLRRAVLDLDSDRKGDPVLLTEAATRSVALGDVDLAERLFRAARDAGGGFEPQLGLGSMLMWRLSAVEEAEHELARAAEEAGTPAERARALRARVQNTYLGRAHIDEATRMLDTELASEPPHADLVATRAFLDALAGRYAPAAQGARAVLDSTEASWAARTLAGWVLVAVRALQGHGHPVELLATDTVVAARNAPECAPLQAAVGFWEVVALGVQGRLATARDRVEEMRAGRGEYTAVFAALLEAQVALDGGRVRTARVLLDRIRPSFPGSSSGWSSQVALMATAATAMAGDAAAATAELEGIRAVLHPGVGLNGNQIGCARAWVSAARGAVDEAVGIARRVAERASGAQEHATEMIARHTAVCFGDRGQAAALRRLREVVDGPRVAAASAHASAWAQRDPAALLRAADTLEELDLLLFAADATAQAATLHRAAGRLGPATAAADRAGRLAERCEGARTPALVEAMSAVGLSQREREIATVAAEGLTNRQVAARLGLSVRTVESHILHARARLGLAGRAELIALVAPDPG